MIPNAAEILRLRHRATGTLRVVAIAGLVGFPWFIVGAVVEGVVDDDLFSYWQYYADRFALGFGGSFTAALLFLLAPVVARWVVPVPGALACPRCWTPLNGLTSPTCPACGLPLTDEFLPPEPDARL